MKKHELMTRIVFGGLARALITVNGRTHPHYTDCYQGSPSRHEPEVEMHNEEHLYENLDHLALARPVTCLGTAPYRTASKDDAKADGKKRKETHGDRQPEVCRCTRAIRKERRNAERERQALLRQPTPVVAMEELERRELNRVPWEKALYLELEEMEMLEMSFYPDRLAVKDAAEDLQNITLVGAMLTDDMLEIVINNSDPASNINEMWAARSAVSRIESVAMRRANEMWVGGKIASYLAVREAEDDGLFSDYDPGDDDYDYGDYDPGPVYDDRDWDYLDSVG